MAFVIDLVLGGDNSWNYNNNKKDDDSNNQAHSHLHILPPHLLSYSVGPTAETLSGHGEVVGLILKGIETFATLRNFVDVLTHDAHGIIDLCLKRGRSLVASTGLRASTGSWRLATRWDVRIVLGLFGHGVERGCGG